MARRRIVALFALVISVAVVAAACGDDKTDSSSSGSSGGAAKPSVLIATQAFGEDEIAGQIYGQVLKANGFPVKYQSFKDRASIYTALEGGDANFVPDYAASALEYLNHNAGQASPQIDTTISKLDEQLKSHKLQTLTPSNAVDTNSLVVTKETSQKDHLTDISQLKDSMKLGGPQDCPTNGSCIPPLQSKYGLNMLKNFVPLDLSGPLTKAALKNGDVDVAVVFSTDSSIAVNGWVELKDTKGIFNSDNIVPVVTDALAGNSTLKSLSDKVSSKLTTANVTAMNKKYDIDKEDADKIAAEFIKSNGL